MDDAAVASENVPLLVHKIPLWVSLARCALDERRIIAVGDKADVLTVGLAGVEKAQFLGDAARVGLFKLAQRQARVRKLLLREGIEHIALILGGVQRLFEYPASVFLPDARVMPRDHGIAAHELRALIQTLEF